MAAYGSDEEFSDWLSAQGLTLPEDAQPVAVLRAIGSAYVDAAYEYRLGCSERTGGFEQELAWPRKGHYLNGKAVPDGLIPQAWVHAAYRAAYLQATQPGWATSSRDGSRVTKRERVDVIEREFFDAATAPGSDAAPGMVSDSIINGLVMPWLCPTGRNINSLFRVV